MAGLTGLTGTEKGIKSWVNDGEQTEGSKSMKLLKSEFALELSSLAHRRAPFRMHAFKWAWLIGFILMGGCSTTDTNNTDTKPWDRPTKADVSQGWWLFNQEDWGPSGSHYP
jgi:hypothetical protein